MDIISDLVRGRKVLFISTKNKDYIRNRQEIRLLKDAALSYEEVVFSDKSYIKRVIKVWTACCKGNWKKADVIFVGFAPQMIWPFLKKWKKKKTVMIDFFISMYDTCVNDRKYFKQRSVAAKILHKIDEITLRRCQYVIADTRAHKHYFSDEFHVPADKIQVMYLEADREIYYPRKADGSAQEDRFTVLYFGSILPLQGVEIVLEAAELLKDNGGIRFVVIGPVKKNTKRYEGDNIEYIDWLSQKELAEKIAEADLCLAGHFNDKIDKAKRTIPGKAYIYEAMGRKMILGDNNANREFFTEDDRHYYVEMGNAAALAEQIVSIAEDMSSRRAASCAKAGV